MNYQMTTTILEHYGAVLSSYISYRLRRPTGRSSPSLIDICLSPNLPAVSFYPRKTKLPQSVLVCVCVCVRCPTSFARLLGPILEPATHSRFEFCRGPFFLYVVQSQGLKLKHDSNCEPFFLLLVCVRMI